MKIPKEKPVKEKRISCPSNKELNPNTGRCVNKCKPGESRNENFHCKKNKTKNSLKFFTPKSKSQSLKNKNCPSNKVLNPVTKRCVNKCKPGESRNENFHCRKTAKKRKTIKNTKK
jgi:hypothetical protein